MKFFQIIGEKLDQVISWLFIFDDNDIQLLIWGGLIAALLVFIIEYLRRPKITISFLDCDFDFNLPNCNGSYLPSKNWKFKVSYKKSFLNKILFRYALNNLKARVFIYDTNFNLLRNFQAKPDSNPNVYQERDVPTALMGINLTKGESDLFPFINKSESGWLPFEVWQIFLCQNRNFLNKDTYFAKVSVTSDQAIKVEWIKFRLSNDNLNFQKLNFLESIKSKFI